VPLVFCKGSLAFSVIAPAGGNGRLWPVQLRDLLCGEARAQDERLFGRGAALLQRCRDAPGVFHAVDPEPVAPAEPAALSLVDPHRHAGPFALLQLLRHAGVDVGDAPAEALKALCSVSVQMGSEGRSPANSEWGAGLRRNGCGWDGRLPRLAGIAGIRSGAVGLTMQRLAQTVRPRLVGEGGREDGADHTGCPVAVRSPIGEVGGRSGVRLPSQSRFASPYRRAHAGGLSGCVSPGPVADLEAGATARPDRCPRPLRVMVRVDPAPVIGRALGWLIDGVNPSRAYGLGKRRERHRAARERGAVVFQMLFGPAAAVPAAVWGLRFLAECRGETTHFVALDFSDRPRRLVFHAWRAAPVEIDAAGVAELDGFTAVQLWAPPGAGADVRWRCGR
jgi:hypothetical protein